MSIMSTGVSLDRPSADATRTGQTTTNTPSRRVAVAGASGLIGTALRAYLNGHGHRVAPLVRRPAQPGTAEIHWDPTAGVIDAVALEGAEAVVNLAGESIAASRWTAERKEAIRSSRVETTRLLSETLARLARRPEVLISASAVGYYGDRGDTPLTEESEAGAGFLADVCRAWEAATTPASEAGIRVVNLRLGIVLSTAGGALARMLTPFRLGAGGRIGNGRQYVSWITLDDVLRAIEHLMHAEGVSGPVNAVAPAPVTNAQFTEALGRVLQRPTWVPTPAFVVRLALGEMGEALLLHSARLKPAKLLAGGFQFLDAELESAFRRILEKT